MEGIVTVLNTPFTANDAIDLDGLRANVSYAIDAGVAGFLVNGLAAEVEYLSPAERETVLERVVEGAGATPVIAGLGFAVDPDIARTASRYLDRGATGLLVNGAGVDRGVLLRVLLELNGLSPHFLMLQDWDATGSGIPVERLLEYVERVPSLRWLKIEVSPAGPKYTELIERGPAGLRVAGGWAVREMMDGLDRGVHAFMPTGLHRTYCEIHRLFVTGRREESSALFERVKPILNFSNQRLELSIAFFKRLLHAQGIYATLNCRVPSARIGSEHEPRVGELVCLGVELERAGALG